MKRASLWALAIVGVIAMAANAGATNLVSNGGFETGDFTGWTVSGNTGCTFDSSSVMVVAGGPGQSLPCGFLGTTIAPNSGNFAAYAGPFSVGTFLGLLSQTLTTTPGTGYFINFSLANIPSGNPFSGTTPNSFVVLWGGTQVFSLTDVGVFGFTAFSIPVSATSTSTLLSFGFINDPSYWAIDDISVTTAPPVPEPSSLILLGSGLLGAAGIVRKKLLR